MNYEYCIYFNRNFGSFGCSIIVFLGLIIDGLCTCRIV